MGSLDNNFMKHSRYENPCYVEKEKLPSFVPILTQVEGSSMSLKCPPGHQPHPRLYNFPCTTPHPLSFELTIILLLSFTTKL